MDGMALLCNLHADGPETLRSLRDEGCTSLEELRELGSERLADLLGFSPAAARRFVREGCMLIERLGGPDAALPSLEGEEALGAPAARPRSLRQPAATDLPESEQALLARVLQHWNQVDPLDAGRTSEAAVEEPGSVPRTEPVLRTEPVPQAEPVAQLEAERGAQPPPDALRPGLLEPLTEAACATLRAQGIETLHELIERPADELARLCDWPFTRVRRLQFLARRAAVSDVLPAVEPAPRRQVALGEKISLAFPDLPAAAPSPHTTERTAAADAPAPAPSGDESAGGPFA